MLDIYDLKIQQTDDKWQATYYTWRQSTCPRIFWVVSGILILLAVIGFVLTFTVCPAHAQIFGVFGSFVPIFLWCVIVAITLSGMQTGEEASPRCASCSNCLWKCLFQLAFWSRINQESLRQGNDVLTELNVLLNSMNDEQESKDACENKNVFGIPNRLSQTKASLNRLKVYNEQLSLMLPRILTQEVRLPNVLSQLILDFLL
jgi:hypothetical protein